MNAKNNQRFHVYSVVDDAVSLARDLRSSPDINEGNVSLSELWNEPSASEAYARVIAHATAEVLVFVHQDVYLPRGWFDRLEQTLARLDRIDPKWAVVGSSGMTHDGTYIGHLWDSGLGRVFGNAFAEPARAASLDETTLILRRASGVSFDPGMPTFHLYGTDIILNAEACGKSAYIVDLPFVHNSRAPRRFRPDYAVAYRFMIRKWRDRLPWPTVIVRLTRNPLALIHRLLRTRYNAIFHPEMYGTRLADPGAKARELGFDAA